MRNLLLVISLLFVASVGCGPPESRVAPPAGWREVTHRHLKFHVPPNLSCINANSPLGPMFGCGDDNMYAEVRNTLPSPTYLHDLFGNRTDFKETTWLVDGKVVGVATYQDKFLVPQAPFTIIAAFPAQGQSLPVMEVHCKTAAEIEIAKTIIRTAKIVAAPAGP